MAHTDPFDALFERARSLGLVTEAEVDRLTDDIAESRASAEDLIRQWEPRVREAETHHPLLGRRVTLAGLKARPDLNGRFGRVIDFNAEKQRLAVKLEGSNAHTMLLKPTNLEPAMDEDERSAQAVWAAWADETRRTGRVTMGKLNAELTAGGFAWLLSFASKAPPEGSAEIASLVAMFAMCACLSPGQGQFANISQDGPANGVAFVDCGGFIAIRDALSIHAATDAVLCERVCALIISLLCDEERLRAARTTTRAHEAGIVRAVVAAMRLHPAHEPLQANGSRMFANMSGEGRPNLAFMTSMMRAGVVEALVAAVEGLPHSRNVQRDAFRAAGTLLVGGGMLGAAKLADGTYAVPDLGEDEAARRDASLVALAKAAIKAIGSEHRRSPAVCGNAIYYLVNVVADPADHASGPNAVQRAIGLGGGAAAACQVLRDYTADQRTVHHALALLGSLVGNGFHPAVTKSGGEEAIRSAMKAHPHDEEVTFMAERALNFLEMGDGAYGWVRAQQAADRAENHGAAVLSLFDQSGDGGSDLVKD